MFVEGEQGQGTIGGMADAAPVAEACAETLGLQEGTRLEPWRALTDAAGNRYYVFAQMLGDTVAYGGAVKVITDARGNLLGVVGSAARELPENTIDEPIAAEAAEQAVLAHEPGAELAPGATQQTLLPLLREPDFEIEQEIEWDRRVWVAYTRNDDADRPYLAHYVTLGGEYLYSLPVKEPGDEASLSGYDAAYAFDGMESAPYTGTVTLSDGSTREITLELMKDAEGTYYLGNLRRRIAVADCYEMLYNHGNLSLVSSAENAGWNDKDLLTLYNYCRAWDYYDAIGWEGADGLGTPMLVLRDFCDKDHIPMDNAAYAGHYYGWEMFLSSDINDLSQCLDVLGHEFTHCVTHSVMTYNAYKNDFGAINEAMSDIQGKLCDMLAGAALSDGWLVGEAGSMGALRSMSRPADKGQPEYTWDIHYVPEVRDPTDINDRGGVHNNSSLLNSVAYRLCAEGGMTLEEARAFWFAVDCTMVPGTDYVQLRTLLPWVMKHQGLERCLPALEDALAATALGQVDVPDTLPANHALLTLELPEEERFMDGNWGLAVVSLDLDGALARMQDILTGSGDYADALDELIEIIRPVPGVEEALKAEDGSVNLTGIVEALMNLWDDMQGEDGGMSSEETQAIFSGASDWFHRNLSDVVFAGMGYAGTDGRTVRMMGRPGLGLPVLVRLELLPNSMSVDSAGLAVYFMGAWHNLTDLVAEAIEQQQAQAQAEDGGFDFSALEAFLDTLAGGEEAAGKPAGESVDEEMADFSSAELAEVIGVIREQIQSYRWLADLMLLRIEGGAENVVPAKGLEKVTTVEGELVKDLFNFLNEEQEAA